MQVRDFKDDLLIIGQDGTPKDVGNMAFNALQGRNIHKGVMYYWSTVIAPYVIFQNNGFKHWRSGKFIDKNKGFVDNIELRMNAFLVAKFSGFKTNMNATKERVKILSKDNPARQKTLLHSVRQVSR